MKDQAPVATQKVENHKVRKAGRAARVHYSGDANQINSWIDSIVSSHLSTDMLQPETIENLNHFFKEIGMNDKKIKCLWDRFSGVTFVEMAQEDLAQSATPDKYRKRFKRILSQLEPYSNIFKEILLGRYN
jgi:hypothetical protein